MPNDRETLVTVEHLSVALDHQTILDDVSFTLDRGEVITILGPNGGGKTVLLRCLLGRLPYTGSIRWREGTRIGYVPQRLPFIRNIPLSVAEFFQLRATPGDVKAALADVGLPEAFAKKPVGELSSGQFQRVLIAWALSANADVLLFDEPTAGVDIGGEETVYSLLARLRGDRNLAMMLVTHDLAVVHRISSSVLCLNRRLVCQGRPMEILTPERLRSLFGTEVAYYMHDHHGVP